MISGKMRVRQILKKSRAKEKVNRHVLNSVTAACFIGSGMMTHACTRAQENAIENADMIFSLCFLLYHLP